MPTSVAFDPTGKFVYVTNYHAANVSAYGFNSSTGALSQTSGSPFSCDKQPISIATIKVKQ
jgi:6-phosphogluconolactonase